MLVVFFMNISYSLFFLILDEMLVVVRFEGFFIGGVFFFKVGVLLFVDVLINIFLDVYFEYLVFVFGIVEVILFLMDS